MLAVGCLVGGCDRVDRGIGNTSFSGGRSERLCVMSVVVCSLASSFRCRLSIGWSSTGPLVSCSSKNCFVAGFPGDLAYTLAAQATFSCVTLPMGSHYSSCRWGPRISNAGVWGLLRLAARRAAWIKRPFTPPHPAVVPHRLLLRAAARLPARRVCFAGAEGARSISAVELQCACARTAASEELRRIWATSHNGDKDGHRFLRSSPSVLPTSRGAEVGQRGGGSAMWRSCAGVTPDLRRRCARPLIRSIDLHLLRSCNSILSPHTTMPSCVLLAPDATRRGLMEDCFGLRAGDPLSTVEEQVRWWLCVWARPHVSAACAHVSVLFFLVGYRGDGGRRELFQACVEGDKMKGFCRGTDVDQYIHVGKASHSVHTSTSGAGVGSITSACRIFGEVPSRWMKCLLHPFFSQTGHLLWKTASVNARSWFLGCQRKDRGSSNFGATEIMKYSIRCWKVSEDAKPRCQDHLYSGSLCDQSWKLRYQPSSSGEAQEQLPPPLNNIIF